MPHDRSELVSFRVSVEELERMNRRVKEDALRSISELVRTALALYLAGFTPVDLCLINHCDFEYREFKKFNGMIKMWLASHDPADLDQYRELAQLLERFSKETRKRHNDLMRELKIKRKGP